MVARPRWLPPWLASRQMPGMSGSRPSTPRLPGFLIPGAQKSGTTWLHEMLGRHDQVFLPDPKEIYYFAERRNYDKGVGWYADHFADAPDGALIGEATANYLWTSDHRAETWAVRHFDAGWCHSIPERIKARLGSDVRFVVLLREPVARAVSAYHHHLKVDGRLDPTTTFADNAAGWGIVHMGFYAAHLRRFYDVFDPAQLAVLLFEEVMADPQSALDTVCDHLGIHRLPLPADVLGERVHAGSTHRGDDGQYYRDDRLQEVAISHADLAMLAEVYAPENEALAALLGRDLDVWERPAPGPDRTGPQ